jgi:hypothetical protein
MAKMTAKKMGTTLLVEASGELSISYAPKAYNSPLQSRSAIN